MGVETAPRFPLTVCNLDEFILRKPRFTGRPDRFVYWNQYTFVVDRDVFVDLHLKAEKTSYSAKLASEEPIVVGVTAGASCPNNLIEDTILRVFELRGVAPELVKAEVARAAAAQVKEQNVKS